MTETHMRWHDLRLDAVRLLITAARQSTGNGGQVDFADFLTNVLVATAADLGGPETLLAGRPGSREACHLANLLDNAANGECRPCPHRRAPLIVPLNVAELVDDRDLHPGLLTLDDAIEVIDARYVGLDETEAVLEAWTVEVEHLSSRYEKAYRSYAERFSDAALLIGRGLTPPIEVRVIAETNPALRWWDDSRVSNPVVSEADPLAATVWQLAHDAVGLPNIDLRIVCGGEADRPSDESW